MVAMIDTAREPLCPFGWRVLDNSTRGIIRWDPDRVELFLDYSQKHGRSILGSELRGKLRGKKTLNAAVLDYLLEHLELIPEEWKDEIVFFPGTLYQRSTDGNPCIRCLIQHNGKWTWGSQRINAYWCYKNPTALLTAA